MLELDSGSNSQNYTIGNMLSFADIAVWSKLKSLFNFLSLTLFKTPLLYQDQKSDRRRSKTMKQLLIMFVAGTSLLQTC